MRTAGAKLLRRAQLAGVVRDDIAMVDVLALAAGVAWAGKNAGQSADTAGKLLSVTLDGLRSQGAVG